MMIYSYNSKTVVVRVNGRVVNCYIELFLIMLKIGIEKNN